MRKISFVGGAILAFLSGLLLTGCAENDYRHGDLAGRPVAFSPSVTETEWNTRSGVQSMDGGLYLHTMVTTMPAAATRGAKYTGTTFSNDETFRVSGYRYGEGETVASVAEANFLQNAVVAKQEGQWLASQQYVWPADGDRIDFFAWFTPSGTSGVEAVNAAGGLKLTYEVPANIDAQPDLLTAVSAGNTFSTVASDAVNLAFQHQLTSVNVVIDENVAPGTITEVAFLNVYTKATLTVGTGWSWTDALKPAVTAWETNFSTTQANGSLVAEGDRTVISGLMMIPQTFTDANQQIRIKMTVDGEPQTLFASLSADLENPTSWQAGQTVTYKISTSSVNVLHMGSIGYPTSWSAADVKSAYAEGDAVGVYCVDAAGRVLYGNKKFTLNSSGQWVCADASTTLFVPGSTYYLYSPWRETLTAAPAAGDNVLISGGLPTCTEFFAPAVAAWVIPVDQSTATRLNAADLQIGSATSAVALSTVNATMAHTMGLACISMGSQMVPDVLYLNADNTENYRTTTKTSVVTSKDFAGNLPCELNNKHYFIVQPGQDYTFNATPEGDLDAWSGNVTANVAAAAIGNYTAPSKFITRNYIYRGWVYPYVANNNYTFTVPTTGTYTFECWGGKGGNATIDSYTGIGGKGGYATGSKSLSSNTQLYICVGGNGESSNTSTANIIAYGGYNGGGNGGGRYSVDTNWGGGGGATHIATASGVLASLSGNKSAVLIVAGGGGGAGACNTGGDAKGGHNGGAGGGESGGNGTGADIGTGGNQSKGGTCAAMTEPYGGTGDFGRGGLYQQNGVHGPGGGGGYYGGGSGYTFGSSGAGGSGYTGGVDNGSMTSGTSDNGYARITSKVIE